MPQFPLVDLRRWVFLPNFNVVWLQLKQLKQLKSATIMTSSSVSSRTVREPVAATTQRLERFVARMERRYGCTSADMMCATATGTARETAEVSRWLVDYQTLVLLRQQPGPTTGSHTSSTR